MAILLKPPDLSTVQRFRGVVDFYCWKGKPVARAWPVRGKIPFTEKQKATWSALRSMHAWIKAAPYSWNKRWQENSMPSRISYEDGRRKAGINLAYAGTLVAPPDVLSVKVSPDVAPQTMIVVIAVSAYPGFSPADLTWRWRGYTGDVPPLEWVDHPGEMDRRGYPKSHFTPDLVEFADPTTEDYNPGTEEYTLTIPGTSPGVQVYPKPAVGASTGPWVGPLFDSGPT